VSYISTVRSAMVVSSVQKVLRAAIIPTKKPPKTSGGCASGIPTRYGMMIAVYISAIVTQITLGAHGNPDLSSPLGVDLRTLRV